MLTRRQLFAWVGGAAAAAAAIPALSRAQITAFKAPANPYYLTNLDTPHWYGGYETLPFEGEEPLRIVGEMKPVVGGQEHYDWTWNRPHDIVDTRDNPALDAAIEQAMKGLA